MTSAPDFTRCDTGLGTTYERWSLNRYLSGLQARLRPASVLEGPGDGMTGIAGLNSLILGRGGAAVRVLLPDPARAAFAQQVWAQHAPAAAPQFDLAWDGACLPYPDASFDLVWNFNRLTLPADPLPLLREMQRVSRRWVLMFVPNRRNYAFWLHRLHHRVAHDPWDHGDVARMLPAAWREPFAAVGLIPQETVWVDCPPWPDIVDLGALIADFFPPLKGLARRARPENRLRWDPADLPYYEPERFPSVHRQMQRLALFEDQPLPWLRAAFAHHFGILARKAS